MDETAETQSSPRRLYLPRVIMVWPNRVLIAPPGFTTNTGCSPARVEVREVQSDAGDICPGFLSNGE